MMLSFHSLPEEVIRSILGFADIASLAALSMSHKATDENNTASLASDDVTWYALVQLRFGIGCSRRNARRMERDGVVLVKRSSSSSLSPAGARSTDDQQQQQQQQPRGLRGVGGGGGGGRKRRPTTYGGATWKDAYRSLASTMRIPETSITSGSHGSAGGAVFATPHRPRGRSGKNSVADFFGSWCMVNHAENCRTKTVQQGRRHNRRRSHHDVVRPNNNNALLPYRVDRRYIELKLCLQNTKSGFGRVVVPDVAAIRIASLEEEDYFSSWGWDKWDDSEYESTFQLIKVGPWAPKILLRRRFHENDDARQQADVDTKEWNARCKEKDLILRPCEVVVLSLHISCPDSLVYETDVLSSMASIRVPIVADGWPSTTKQAMDKGCIKHKDVSVARFVLEDDLWEHYCQLPGGCMSLTDRSRLVPV